MAEQQRQINFTIVPADTEGQDRTYVNFCAVSHTPFDFTLTFCEVLPLSERDIAQAQQNHVVRAPVRARIAVPVHILPSLIAALQEQLASFNEAYANAPLPKGPVH
jgi:hypothetical protein